MASCTTSEIFMHGTVITYIANRRTLGGRSWPAWVLSPADVIESISQIGPVFSIHGMNKFEVHINGVWRSVEDSKLRPRTQTGDCRCTRTWQILFLSVRLRLLHEMEIAVACSRAIWDRRSPVEWFYRNE